MTGARDGVSDPWGDDPCTCERDAGCAGEGWDYDDPRTCQYCADLDGEWPCPAEVHADGPIGSDG